MPIGEPSSTFAAPPPPTVPPLMTVTEPMRSSRAWCVWPTKNTSGVVRGGSARSSSNTSCGELRAVDHDRVDLVADRLEPRPERLLLLDRRRPAVVAVVLAGAALERVVVSGDAEARLPDDPRAVAAVGHEAPAPRQDDGAGAREPPSSVSESWLPAT